TTKPSWSAGAATGALLRISTVSTAAPARHARINASNGGNRLILEAVISLIVIDFGPAAINSRPAESSGSPPNSSNLAPATPRRRDETPPRDTHRNESP